MYGTDGSMSGASADTIDSANHVSQLSIARPDEKRGLPLARGTT
jgi:hypothetical protein